MTNGRNMAAALSGLTFALAGAGCSGGGGDDFPILNDPFDGGPVDATLRINVVQADGDSDRANDTAVAQGTLRVIEDGLDIVPDDSEELAFTGGQINVPLNKKNLVDADENGIIDGLTQIEFVVNADGFITTNGIASVAVPGENRQRVPMVSIADPPPGVQVANAQNQDARTSEVVVDTTAGGGTPIPGTRVTLPAGTTLTDENGEVLNSGSLNIVVGAFDATDAEALEAFPGGLDVSVGNPGAVPGGNDNAQGEFTSAGFISVDIVDDQGRIARNVVTEPVEIRVPISPELPNPETGERIEVGDTVPLWSLNSDTGEWQFERKGTVVTDQSGQRFLKFTTDHFTYFNLDFFLGGERCGNVVFNVEDTDGNPFPRTTVVRLIRDNGAGFAKGIDYQGGDGEITFVRSSDNPAVLQLPGGDNIVSFDGDGTLRADDGQITSLNLCNSNGATLVLRSRSDAAPRFLTGSGFNAAENQPGQHVFTFNLNDDAVSPVTFRVSTEDGSATAGEDYSALTDQLVTIPGGDDSVEVPVSVNDDGEVEGHESFRLRVSDLSSNASDSFLRNPLTAVIANDDQPDVTIPPVTVNEGDGTAAINLVVSEPVPYPITGAFHTRDTDNVNDTAKAHLDFIPVAKQTFEIPANANSVQVEVPIVDDADVEPDETFQVALFNLDDGEPGNNFGTVTIAEDGADAVDDTAVPEVSIDPVRFMEKNYQSRRVFMRVALSSARSGDVSLDLTAEDDTATSVDYENFDTDGTTAQIDSSTLSYADGEATKLVAVDIVGDLDNEGDETFDLVFSNVANATPQANPTPITIADNDFPVVNIDVRPVVEGDPGDPTEQAMVIALTRTVDEPVTVDLSFASDTAQAGTDFTVPSTTATIPANTPSTTINVPIAPDDIAEGNESYTVTMTAAQGGLPTGVALSPDNQAQAVIRDNDFVTVEVSDGVSAPEGDPVEFDFQLTGATELARSITLNLETEDGDAVAGVDYVANSGDLTFSDTTVTGTFTVQTKTDDNVEDNEFFFLLISTDSGLVARSPMTATGVIEDTTTATGGTGGTGGQGGTTGGGGF